MKKLLVEVGVATVLTLVAWLVTNVAMNLGWPPWIYLLVLAGLVPVVWLFTRTRFLINVLGTVGDYVSH